MLYTLFSTGLKAEGVLFFLLKSMKSGNFHPFYRREQAERMFAEILAKVFLTDHPDKMTNLGAWQHLLNNKAAGVVGTRSMMQDQLQEASGADDLPGFSREDRIQMAQELASGVKQLKVIEDWIFYHRDRLSFIQERGQVLLPQLSAFHKPEVIRKVVIIESEASFATIAKKYLERFDVTVTAFDADRPIGKQIDELIDRQFDGTDLILLDSLSGSDFDGVEAAKRLRAGGYNNYIAATALYPPDNEGMLWIKGLVNFVIPGKAYHSFKLFVDK
jgi:hypothetical protein